MTDKRAYFKLDVGYMSNPKVLAVMDESPTAILLHVASIGYAAQHLTDGIVPVKALLRMTGASEDDAQLLYAAGLWTEGPTGGKATVHDYLEHQRSAAEAKGASEKAKRAAEAKWDAQRNASSNAVSTASSVPDAMPDAMPDASESAMPREEREKRDNEDFVFVSEVGDEDTPEPSTALALVAEDRPDVDRVCEHFVEASVAIGRKRETPTKAWRNAARLMLDKDGITEAEAHGCITWLFTSDHRDAQFWRVNIRAMPKLRDEFERLRELSRRTPTSQQTNPNRDPDFLSRAMARAEAKEAQMRGETA